MGENPAKGKHAVGMPMAFLMNPDKSYEDAYNKMDGVCTTARVWRDKELFDRQKAQS